MDASWKVSKWRQAGTAAGRKTLRMSRPFDAKVDELSTGAGFLTCWSSPLPKPSPQESRVTDGPCRLGESNSPLTVTRSCGICTHFPFPLMHPGRVLTSAQMLTNRGEASQAVSERTGLEDSAEMSLRRSRCGGNRNPAGDFRLTLTTITDDDIAVNARFGSPVATERHQKLRP